MASKQNVLTKTWISKSNSKSNFSINISKNKSKCKCFRKICNYEQTKKNEMIGKVFEPKVKQPNRKRRIKLKETSWICSFLLEIHISE